MNFNIELTGIDEITTALNVDLDEVFGKIITKLSQEMKIEAKKNLDNRIYSNAPSPKYKRTGLAKKGIMRFKKGTEGQVIADTTRAGADKNYLPFLNRNSRISKLNTRFWDDAEKTTIENSQEIAEKILKNSLK